MLNPKLSSTAWAARFDGMIDTSVYSISMSVTIFSCMTQWIIFKFVLIILLMAVDIGWDSYQVNVKSSFLNALLLGNAQIFVELYRLLKDH